MFQLMEIENWQIKELTQVWLSVMHEKFMSVMSVQAA